MSNWYDHRPYVAVNPPQADTEELAAKGDRLMFRHDNYESYLFVAPKDMMHSGWVLGVFENSCTEVNGITIVRNNT